jgi:hypothetical protein
VTAGRFRRAPAPFAVAGFAVAAVLAGCSASEAPRPACPRAGVLSEAVTLTRFADRPGRDLLDVDFEVEVSDLRSGCQFEEAGDGRYGLVVAVAPVFTATRGPANETRQARFGYFVGVLDADRSVRSRAEFAVEVEFEGNQRRIVRSDDDPPVTIDLPIDRIADAAGYQVIVGLQLTPEELEFNRRRRTQAR